MSLYTSRELEREARLAFRVAGLLPAGPVPWLP